MFTDSNGSSALVQFAAGRIILSPVTDLSSPPSASAPVQSGSDCPPPPSTGDASMSPAATAAGGSASPATSTGAGGKQYRAVADPRPGVFSVQRASGNSSGEKSVEMCWHPLRGGLSLSTAPSPAGEHGNVAPAMSSSDKEKEGKGEDGALRVSVPYGSAVVDWVSQCTSGRCFSVCLKGKHDPENAFLFWMQRSNQEEDTALLRQTRDALHARKTNERAASDSKIRCVSEVPSHAPEGSPVTPQDETASSSTAPPLLLAGSGTADGRRYNAEGIEHRHVDLQTILLSDSLRQALLEDPEFYNQRLQDFYPDYISGPSAAEDAECTMAPTETSTIPRVLREIRNDQTSAAAARLSHNLISYGSAYSQLCSIFGLKQYTKTFTTNTDPEGGMIGAPVVPGARRRDSEVMRLLIALIEEGEEKKKSESKE